MRTRPAHDRGMALHTMAVDAQAAALSSALAEAGIRAILLKGASLRAWLYADDDARAYGDVDLLVDPRSLDAAGAVLEDLGMRPTAHQPGEANEQWLPAPGKPQIGLDLHWSFHHLAAPPLTCWAALSAATEPLRLAGADVETLAAPARALLVALHYAMHGRAAGQQQQDVDRAIARAGDEAWTGAAQLAAELGAREPLAAALRDRPGGGELADRLGLPGAVTPKLALHLASPPDTAHGFRRMSEQEGWRRRARMLGAELVPPVSEMRFHYALARRGVPGLAASYVLRPFWLAWHAPAGLRAWRRELRAAQPPPPTGDSAGHVAD